VTDLGRHRATTSAALALIALSLSVATGTVNAQGAPRASTGQAAPSAASAPVVAPYVDASLSGEYSFVYHAIKSQHLKAITAGFVISHAGSCTPLWGDGLPVANDPGVSQMISTARADGAAVIVSFGGENGNEIATTCGSTKKLTAAYRSVVTKLKVTHLDFDIEGAALAKPASIKRRFAAIHALEASDHQLVVSLTVPVTPTGLDSLGTGLLKAAKRAKARIDLLNVMAMDYGTKREMGSTAVTVAKDALRQLRHYSPHATYRNIGITPMIGRNDTASDVTTLADARTVASFARAHHVGRLAFWSLDRDQKCDAPQTAAQFDCSGVSQSPLEFTHTFLH
jgi:hypothetical protein